jgi:dTDP-4-dehydrorhamnose 3,5-epimerase
VIFKELKLSGAFLVCPEPHADARGFYAGTWSADEFKARGLNPRIAQCSVSWNRLKGTLRGMHYQIAPYREAKLVRCTRGAIHDVLIDLRPDSPTFRQHVSAELTVENRHALYVPEGLAHGFISLTDDTEVFYQLSEFWSPSHARGVRWNDPAFAIPWPMKPAVIADRDNGYADFLG